MVPKRDLQLEQVTKLVTTASNALNITVQMAMRAKGFTDHDTSNQTLQYRVWRHAKALTGCLQPIPTNQDLTIMSIPISIKGSFSTATNEMDNVSSNNETSKKKGVKKWVKRLKHNWKMKMMTKITKTTKEMIKVKRILISKKTIINHGYLQTWLNVHCIHTICVDFSFWTKCYNEVDSWFHKLWQRLSKHRNKNYTIACLCRRIEDCCLQV